MKINEISTLALSLIILPGTVLATDYMWTDASGNGDWTDTTKWIPSGSYPNGTGDTVTLDNVAGTSDVTLTIDTPVTVGDLDWAGSPNRTIRFASSSATNTLTLDDGVADGDTITISSASVSHTVWTGARLVLTDHLTMEVTGNSNQNRIGIISESGGSFSVTLAGNNKEHKFGDNATPSTFTGGLVIPEGLTKIKVKYGTGVGTGPITLGGQMLPEQTPAGGIDIVNDIKIVSDTAKIYNLNPTKPWRFTGIISDDGGAGRTLRLESGTNAAPLDHVIGGTSPNTHAGGTVLQANNITDPAQFSAEKDGAFGTGNLELVNKVILRITDSGGTEDRIADSARVDLSADALLQLETNVTETVDQVWVDGVQIAPGTYNNSESWITGDGTITVGQATGFKLTIAQNGADLDFTWESRVGKLYDLLSSIDLSTPRASWPVWGSHGDIPASGSGINLLTIPRPPGDPTRFFAVLEKELLEENFDTTTAGSLPAGWTSVPNAGDAGNTFWQLGSPAGGPVTGPSEANSLDNCCGTNITANYGIDTDISLISPAIDLTDAAITAATLSFQQFLDTDLVGDIGTINVLDAGSGDAFVEQVDTGLGGDGSLGWEAYSTALPAAALGKNIRIEFVFTSNSDSAVYTGWYIDDVKVSATAP